MTRLGVTQVSSHEDCYWASVNAWSSQAVLVGKRSVSKSFKLFVEFSGLDCRSDVPVFFVIGQDSSQPLKHGIDDGGTGLSYSLCLWSITFGLFQFSPFLSQS